VTLDEGCRVHPVTEGAMSSRVANAFTLTTLTTFQA